VEDYSKQIHNPCARQTASLVCPLKADILYQLLATPGVNVAKNVKQWSSSPELGKKVGTSEAVEIQMTFWRTIGNENINIIRYGIMPNVELARVLEGPVSLLWCPRASMYFKLAT